LMTFCATICESNISIVAINAMPQTIKAKAIGMPSAMAPSSEKVKTAMVMTVLPTAGRVWASGTGPRGILSRVFLRLLHGDKILLIDLSTQHPQGVEQQDDPGRDAEHHAGEIEDGNRQARGWSAVSEVDHGLRPAPLQKQQIREQHQGIVHEETDPPPSWR